MHFGLIHPSLFLEGILSSLIVCAFSHIAIQLLGLPLNRRKGGNIFPLAVTVAAKVMHLVSHGCSCMDYLLSLDVKHFACMVGIWD
jgi:hypothetical protein